ncbi:Uncharacterized protein APZ42_021766 [Daphnia magna]|uniref:Uncharacterized protein n=1 Tax=Daphnia magna TaxID=35525 RepID=A0A164WD65_9CRUS|nr:Uncharacterized protein APZ42_021766 [Daphnia magna]
MDRIKRHDSTETLPPLDYFKNASCPSIPVRYLLATDGDTHTHKSAQVFFFFFSRL